MQRCVEGDPLSMGAIGILASQRHCRRLWQCQVLTALVMAAVHDRSGSARVVAVCAMSCVAPLFPPRAKRLSQLGSVVEHGNGFRARIKFGNREQHIGPLRSTKVEALSDLAAMRDVSSRADVGSVAARLLADAATHRVHRETMGDAEDGGLRDANAATGHTDVSATGHAIVSATDQDYQGDQTPLRGDAATHRVHREAPRGDEVSLRGNAATHRGWPRLKRMSELGCVYQHGNGFRARVKLGHQEQYVGPLRATEARARSDLIEMRGVASRVDVGSVVARLQAEAVTLASESPPQPQLVSELDSAQRRRNGRACWNGKSPRRKALRTTA